VGDIVTVPPQCSSDAECDKLLGPITTLCFAPRCASGSCEIGQDPDGTPCDDGSKCLVGKACKGGYCLGGVKKVCDDKQQCTVGACVPKQGCTFAPKSKGTPCKLADKCLHDARCQTGTCKGKPIPSSLPPNPCVKAVCDSKTGKTTFTDLVDGGICTDGDVCTIDDYCVSGACVGKLLKCDDGNPCTVDACDPKKAACASVSKPDGDACDDGNPCTKKDACKAVKCIGQPYAKSKHCDDGNLCTDDACDPTMGCLNTANAAPCDDKNPCTVKDRCVSQTCGGQVKNCDDGKPCTHDHCDGKTGKCAATTFKGPCDDGKPCTINDTCHNNWSGLVCAGEPRDCDDGNPCTEDACASQGGCAAVALPNGVTCDDGLSCTRGDRCEKGVCTAPKALNACVGCKSGNDCLHLDDGDLCNGTMACLPAPGGGGVCALDPATANTCAGVGDGVCTFGCCQPATGKCVVDKLATGATCDDGNACTRHTRCSAKGVCAGVPRNCDDDQTCTIDSCDAIGGCVHKNVQNHEVCDDGNKCTVGEACKAGKCVTTKAGVCSCTSDHDCFKFDDGNLCNGVFRCLGGFCEPKPNSAVTCPNSGDPCKLSYCQKNTGKCKVIATPEGGGCDDGHPCTAQDTCKNGKCVGVPKKADELCGDCNPCTVATCTKDKGCVAVPRAKGTACDDGTTCTPKSACTGGPDARCEGKVKDCGDGNACTLDRCVTGTGCVHTPATGQPCTDNNLCTEGDACTAKGTCAAKIADCNKLLGAPCQKLPAKCDPKLGCKTVAADGAKCDDGDKCTGPDVCKGQDCVAGGPVVCDDSNMCTVDKCAPDKGCQHAPKSCDDGNSCTFDKCDKLKGCVTIDVKNGADCNDGCVCLQNTKCYGGICSGGKNTCFVCKTNKDCAFFGNGDRCDGWLECAPGPCSQAKYCQPRNDPTMGQEPITCDASADKPCLRNLCQPKTGECLMTKTPATGACDDGNPCTSPGTCDANGECIGQVAFDCSNHDNICNLGACAADAKAPKGFSCTRKPRPGTVTCDADGDGCTGLDICVAGKCAAGAPIDCSMFDGPCTSGSCTSGGGTAYSCKKTTFPGGKPCDADGSKCTVSGACKSGVCAGEKPKDCDDNNKCTLDGCRASDGKCVHGIIAGCK